jgi:hypothetical protein
MATVVTMSWSSVGNPGNAADAAVMITDGTTGPAPIRYRST